MIAVLLLAAGSARRFGSQKLLARLPDGRRVVEAAAANLLTSSTRVVAVSARDDALMRVLSDCGCEVVVNDQAEQGMGTSIAAGVRASADAAGWLIALGDMPVVQPQTIASLLKSLQSAQSIVMPESGGNRGHPVLFGRAYFAALSALEGDRGARAIVEQHAEHLQLLHVDDAGIFADIDAPADLKTAAAIVAGCALPPPTCGKTAG